MEFWQAFLDRNIHSDSTENITFSAHSKYCYMDFLSAEDGLCYFALVDVMK